jgi:hypothetical protein
VTVVQVHPDAESMATHMRLIMQHISEAYADYLEPESTMQIYGHHLRRTGPHDRRSVAGKDGRRHHP